MQTLGLILKNPPKGSSVPIATIIVCPKTVIANWDQQIKDHVKPGTLRVGIYAGRFQYIVVLVFNQKTPLTTKSRSFFAQAPSVLLSSRSSRITRLMLSSLAMEPSPPTSTRRAQRTHLLDYRMSPSLT